MALEGFAAREMPCRTWRPQTVLCDFPTGRVEVLRAWNCDDLPCGGRPVGLDAGNGGWNRERTKRWDTRVYVTNLDALSAPNSLLFDYADDPDEKNNTLGGYVYLNFPRTVTNGWAFLSFDFKLEKGTCGMELRGQVAGDREAKPDAKFHPLGIAYYLSIGDDFSMREASGGGRASAGPVQRFKWYRLSFWLQTEHGCRQGIQKGGWLRLDQLADDGSPVAYGEPVRIVVNWIFMKGPWTCLDFHGNGPLRVLIDNFVYGRVE